MEIAKKLSNTADRLNPVTRKKSLGSIELHKSSHENEESETETSDSLKKHGKTRSCDTITSQRPRSSSSSAGSKHSSKKKHSSTDTIEEELAALGKVSTNVLAATKISKKHALQNEMRMHEYLKTLSDQLYTQDQEIQALQAQVSKLQHTHYQFVLNEANRKLDDEARIQQQQQKERGVFSCLVDLPDDERSECTLF